MILPELSTVRLSLDGSVLTIELNRPHALNALTVRSGDELRAALTVAEDPAVRAVVVTGAGRAFSSGADLKDTAGPTLPSGLPDLERALNEHFNPAVLALRALPKPVVAAVNGPAVGIAVSIALACDLVLAARSAYFLLSFTGIGLVPDGGASVLIPARVGMGRFAQLALLAERLPAPSALDWGLVDGVEDDEGLAPAAAALGLRLAGGATGAYAQVKRLVDAGPLAGLPRALGLEAELQGARADSREFAEGVAAFLERRPPKY